MERDIRRLVVLLAAVAMTLVATSFAARRGADAGAQSEVAKATVAPHLISWEPLVSYESIDLVVTGNDGEVYETTFAPGMAVLFDLFNKSGVPLADGTYSYELRFTPTLSAQTRGLLETARENGTVEETQDRLRSLGALPAVSMTKSGFFTIKEGSLVDPDLVEAGADGNQTDYRLGSVAPQDIVHNDDVIITFSLCVGTDCVNGESFGFDTIRLKENNLRIRAFDTSNSSSFPTRDWQIVFNDSSNGGAEKFAIDDLDGGRTPFSIIAGAPSNSLFVASSGNVGLNTSTPVVELHIVDGDSPTLRLEQNGSSGFTPQTWDVAGNETNFFVRDVTNGSTLPLRIRPSAPSNSIYIDTDGDVGLGTASPSEDLHVFDSTSGNAARIVIEDTNTADNPGFTIKSANATSDWEFRIDGNGSFIINSVSVSGGPELDIRESDGRVNIRNNLNVMGTLTKASGSFKIDHPLDPTGKYLYHSFVESPDMMNIYNGNAVLDEEGRAWVEMPSWFQALNQDFRYQLTPIGGPGPNLYVAAEIANNRFQIAGGTPGSRVSWQVTGIRHDPYAEKNRIKVEEEKPMPELGSYLHPEAYGQPLSKGLYWALEHSRENGDTKSSVAPKDE